MKTPEIGMGLTYSIGSDAYPATVTKVSESGKTIWFQDDDYKRTDKNGLSESQEYEYSRNTSNRTQKATLRSDGSFKISKSQFTIHLGTRNAYRDPHF